MKILLIDNFDSFTQNIAQYLYELTGVCVDVVTNTVPYRELNIENYDAVVLSHGHGHPGSSLDFGVCGDVILQSPVPCLGFAGASRNCAIPRRDGHSRPKPVHGYRSRITHIGTGLFRDLPEQFDVVRYHSLACTHLPDELHCTAWTDDGVIMAIEHINRPVWGCSSILSPSTPSMDMRYLVILCEWRWSTTAFIICIRGAALGASQQKTPFSLSVACRICSWCIESIRDLHTTGFVFAVLCH